MGQLAIVMLSITYLPITRNSIWIFILGIPFERAVKFHRWVGRSAVIVVLIHGVLMTLNKGTGVLFSMTSIPHGESVFWGTVAGICFATAGILAYEPIRRLKFELFYHTHFLVLAGTVFAWLHCVYFRPWIYAPVALYLLDRMIRFFRSRRSWQFVSTRVLANGMDGQVTELVLRYPGFRFNAGDYCFIRIPAVSMLEWHPFSISSGPSPRDDGRLRFHCLDMGRGTWTGRLAALTKKGQALHDDIPAFTKIEVDGPHGKLTMPIDKYPVIILAAGGVGVTPILSVLEDLYNRRHQMPHLSAVHFIWASRHHEAFTEWFPDFLKHIHSEKESKFYLHLYWTDRKNRPPHLIPVPVSSASLKNRNVLAATQTMGEFQPGSVSGPQPPKAAVRNGGGGAEGESLLSTGGRSDHLYKLEDPLADVSELPIDRMHRPDYATLFDVFSRNADSHQEVCVLACGPKDMIEAAQNAALERGFAFHKETYFL